MTDDPRFRTLRIVDRNMGAAETERLSRGNTILSDIVGPNQINAFYSAFAERCGAALPTAMVQLLDFAERRCNVSARERDPKIHDSIKAWTDPGAMDAIYLNACVEKYNREKDWAQTSDAQREQSITRTRFGEELSEESKLGALDKAKETGTGVLLAGGISYLVGAMDLVAKLPDGMRDAIQEAAKSGAEVLSTLHNVAPSNVSSLVVGLGVAGGIIFGKALVSAVWKSKSEAHKRVSVACDIPRSLALLDRDQAWEPRILAVPALAYGLNLKEIPPVWDKESFQALSMNRWSIQAHVALCASEIKQTWALLSEKQKESSRDMPAAQAVGIASRAIESMRRAAEMGGYGSHDIASLDRGERERLAQAAFEAGAGQSLPMGAPALGGDAKAVRDKLLSRRPISAASSRASSPS